jgi:hypothetical protein
MYPSIMGAQPVAISDDDAKSIAAATVPLDDERLTIAELMRLAGWTEADYRAARDLHGLPPVDGYRRDMATNYHGGPGEPTRLRRLALKWAAEQKVLAEQKLRLVDRLLTVK